MTNPFPGVDPYVEAQGLWRDFHATFLNYLREAIGDRLPDNYEARIDEHVKPVDIEMGIEARIYPDVAVTRGESPRPGGGGTSVLEPETMPTVIFDEVRQLYLEILHRPDRQLVAVVELLSPSNKAGGSRRDSLVRRNAILRQEDVHLVELDLLIGGERLPMRRPLPRGEFYAVVAGAGRRPDCDVYAWGLDDPLPPIPIPLREPDPDVVVDLAAVYSQAYERGRYARSIDRRAPLEPPLPPERRDRAEGRPS
jgi:hypothetical protein